MNYPFQKIESKWQKYWLRHNTFRTPDLSKKNLKKPPYYCLDMFPYPSASGLHVGHPEGYTATDIIARYKRMCGFQVLHPIGWDAFGLPAERYAQKTGIHPRKSTQQNINNFRRQLQKIGFSYDWKREVNTTDPDYYRWTQWIFLQLFHSYYDKQKKCARPIQELSIPKNIAKNPTQIFDYVNAHRLAYIAKIPVNWCEELGTVLANEEIEEWKDKGFSIVQKPMRQWMLRITAYAQRLLDDLELVDWPSGTLDLQKNWIGRSEGAIIDFPVTIEESCLQIQVFTTRPDTVFGISYLALAPENPLVDQLTTSQYRKNAQALIQQTQHISDRHRKMTKQRVRGCFLGSFAQHPFDHNKKIPIWIADYVLMEYGSGSIMGVPAHDQRDFIFAKKYKLPILPVVASEHNKFKTLDKAMIEFGTCINSDFINGLPSHKAKQRVIQELENTKKGYKKIQYRLRDWIFSRQRYWGEPIPISSDEQGYYHPETSLPLLLPEVQNFLSTEGKNPLAENKAWLTHYSKDDKKLKRESNTMPQWAGSCWYYLRFLDPNNQQQLVGTQQEQYWLGEKGVDLYIGGKEHAVLHLLYARFWHKFLYDINVISGKEPFTRLVHQGIILGEDGRKMSKSLGNVVSPDTVIAKNGADALRCFEMFLGPLEQDKRWSTRGIEGINRFLMRIWKLFIVDDKINPLLLKEAKGQEAQELHSLIHMTIQKVTHDIEKLAFNTAISQLMIFINYAQRAKTGIGKDICEKFILLLSPFAPHLSEELWQLIGHKKSIAYHPWPKYEHKFFQKSTYTLIIQINGKLRAKQVVGIDTTEQQLKYLAVNDKRIKLYLNNNKLKVKKTILVPGKLVNLVCEQ